jgi:N12 class adenine-specific DNA methylase
VPPPPAGTIPLPAAAQPAPASVAPPPNTVPYVKTWQDQAFDEIARTPGLDRGGQRAVLEKYQAAAQGPLTSETYLRQTSEALPLGQRLLEYGVAGAKGLGKAGTAPIGLIAPGFVNNVNQRLDREVHQPDTWGNFIAGGLGGALPMLATAGAASPFTAATGMGALSAAGGARQEVAQINIARARAGLPPVAAAAEVAGTVGQGLVGAAEGYTEGLLMALPGRLVRGVSNPLLRGAAAVGTEVAGEAVQNVPAHVAGNAVAAATYDPGRDVTQGWERAALEGAVGGLAFGVAGVRGANAGHRDVVGQQIGEAIGRPALVTDVRQTRETVAATEVVRAAIGKDPVWFYTPGDAAAQAGGSVYFDPKRQQIYLNAADPTSAAEEAYHALFRDAAVGPELRAFAAENPDAVGLAADTYGGRAAERGRPDVAAAVAEPGDLRTDEGVANLGQEALTPDAVERLADENPAAFVRMAERVLGVFDRMAGTDTVRSRLAERRYRQFVDPLRENLDAARAKLGAERAGQEVRREERVLDAVDPAVTRQVRADRADDQAFDDFLRQEAAEVEQYADAFEERASLVGEDVEAARRARGQEAGTPAAATPILRSEPAPPPTPDPGVPEAGPAVTTAAPPAGDAPRQDERPPTAGPAAGAPPERIEHAASRVNANLTTGQTHADAVEPPAASGPSEPVARPGDAPSSAGAHLAEFARGDVVEATLGGAWGVPQADGSIRGRPVRFEVVAPDVRGMAKLRNLETGEVEAFNAWNNRGRFTKLDPPAPATNVAQPAPPPAAKPKRPRKAATPVTPQVPQAAPPPALTPSAPPAPAETGSAGDPPAAPTAAAAAATGFGDANKVFTKAAFEDARAKLREKLNRLNSIGPDPEMISLAAQVAGFYVEGGVRTFADFARTAVREFGDKIKPYLKMAYNAVRDYPGMERIAAEMDDYPTVKAASLDDLAPDSAAPAAPPAGTLQPETADGRPEPPLGDDGDPPLARDAAGDGGGAGAGGDAGADGGGGGRSGGDRVRADGRERDGRQRGDGAGAGRARADAAPADAGRAAGRGGSGAGQPGGGARPDAAARADAPAADAGNFVIDDPDALHRGGLKAKFRANVEAIRLLRQIEAEGRGATPTEQRTLARFTGWGAMPGAFNDKGDAGDWTAERDEVKALLTDEEFAAAARSALNAHYTAGPVVRAVWEAAAHMGFAGGRVLEPSMGVGNFFGLVPAALRSHVRLTGVELDRLTGRIARLLYPKANVQVKGFQDVKAPDGFFDLAISNVPFGDYRVSDAAYNRYRANIHDYFLLKMLDKTRPGGLVVAITSTGTMDKANPSVRRALAERGDLVAGIRLPGGAFKANAGTDVVTDLLIFRRREAGAAPSGEAWADVTTVPDPAGGQPIPVNEYFARHPGQILGRLDRTGTMYAGNQVNVTMTGDVAEMLRAAVARLPKDAFTPATSKAADDRALVADAAVGGKEGSLIVQGGKVFRRTNGALDPVEADRKRAAIVGGTLAVRDALRDVIAAQLDRRPEADKAAARERLNAAYDTFVKKHGPLHRQANAKAFAGDPDAPLVLALEDYDPKAKRARKSDVFTKDTIRGLERPTKAADAGEAVGISLNETGRVDVKRVAELTGQDEAAAGRALIAAGLAYENPAGGWESAEQYLSGNVRRKLIEAREAADADERYGPNVGALERVQPADVPHDEIDVKLGAPWVPTSDVARFAADTLGGTVEHVTVKYLPSSGEWLADWTHQGAQRWANSPAARELYGTPRAPFMDVFEAALNNRQITIYDPGPTKDTRVVNHSASADANAKVAELRERFKEWVWEDDGRRGRLHRYYNDTFNSLRPVAYSGRHLTFPGMNPAIRLMDHQRNAVWRTISNGTALYAHEVGTGKTYTMVAAAMELRRLGLARKPMIAALKANVAAVAADAKRLYPAARVLHIENFEAKNRRQTVARIATGDWDLVVLTHDNLDMLPMSAATQEEFVRGEIAELEAVMAEVGEAADAKSKSGNRLVKRMEKMKLRLEERLEKALDAARKDDTVTFEETGVDALFVDEAHYYKTLPVYTKQDRIKGVPTGRSDRATGMWMRTQWLQRQNGGRGVVFATGTPITNTMAELYTMQRYLQMPDLKARGIDAFDAWAATFGEVVTTMEYKVTGEYAPVSRFAEFSNLAELSQLARQIVDIQRAEDIPGFVRPARRDAVRAAPMNDAQRSFLGEIQQRAAAIKGKRVEKGGDNMLKISTDARKAALDMRLVDPGAEYDPDGKVAKAINAVLATWKADPTVTQMVFADMGVSTTPWGFRLYDDIIDRLVAGGIPREKIVDFSGLTDAQKPKAATRLKDGDAVVGIGSTKKMGTGVNAQDHLLTLHHLDIAWTPGDLEQRDGRGWRQGNRHATVNLDRYVTEGSFDTFMWQVVDKKSRFIRQFVDGKDVGRRIRDDDTEELSPAQVMAIASGNPLLLEKVQVDKDVSDLQAAERRHTRGELQLRDAAVGLRRQIERASGEAAAYAADAETARAAPEAFAVTIEGTAYADREAADQALTEFKARHTFDKVGTEAPLGEFRGFGLTWRKHTVTEQQILVRGAGVTTGSATLGSVETRTRPAYFEAAAQKARTQADQARADLAKLEGQAGKPFGKADALAKAKARQAEITATLAAANKPADPPADAGDPDAPRMAFGRGAPPAPTVGDAFELSNESTWETVRRVVQDEFRPVTRMQDDLRRQGAVIGEDADVYLKTELFKGRAATQIAKLEEDYVRPIVERMTAAGLTLDDVDRYLYALHAPERNAQVATVNPAMPAGGSGMTDERAAEVVDAARASGRLADYDAIADLVHRMNDQTLGLMVDAGLLDAAAAGAMRATYRKYVPLRTDMEDDGFPSVRPGRGFDVRGRDSVRAAGRASLADSPLTFSLMQAQEKIVRAEKNRVAQAMLRLVTQNPDPGLWAVDPMPMQRIVDPRTGLARDVPDRRFTEADHVVAVKVAGRTHLIEFKGEAGRRIAGAMKRLNFQDGGAVVRWLGRGMRVYASLQTNLNPEFILPNMIRDVQTAGINLSAERGRAMAYRMVRAVPKAWRAVFDVSGDRAAKPGSAYHDYMREYLDHGGKVDAYGLGDFDRTGKRIETLLKDASPTKARRLLIAAKKAGAAIDRVNGATETATRLAAYAEARKAGLTPERAASLAKNLTVNFNRKGEVGTAVNALYLFANASLQGNVRFAAAMLKTRRGRQVGAGILLAGLAYGLLAPELFGEDEEGRNVCDTIPDPVKGTNLVLPAGGTAYAKVPLPYGFNSLFSAGRLLGETVTARKAPAAAAADLLVAGAAAFNPLGQEGSFLQTLAPTALDPFVQVAENKDWAGQPIVPGQPAFGPRKPDSELAMRDTSAFSRAVARWLNDVTGGDEVAPGAVDVSPATLDHWMGWAGGGTGRFVNRVADLPARVGGDDKVRASAVPVANRFVGQPSETINAREFRDAMAAAEDAGADLKHYEDAGKDDEAQSLRESASKPLRFARWAADVRQRGTALRSKADAARARGDDGAAAEAEAASKALMHDFVVAYRRDELPREWETENERAALEARERMYRRAREALATRGGDRATLARQMRRGRLSESERQRLQRLREVDRRADQVRERARRGEVSAGEAERQIRRLRSAA